MRNVSFHISMTVDGFVAGPNGEMDWLALDCQSWVADVERMQEETDTVLLGQINLQLVKVKPHASGSLFLRYRQARNEEQN